MKRYTGNVTVGTVGKLSKAHSTVFKMKCNETVEHVQEPNRCATRRPELSPQRAD